MENEFIRKKGKIAKSIMPKLIALISKKSSISEEDFKTYYENNHVPLIESLFPTLNGYTRTYLFESNFVLQTHIRTCSEKPYAKER